MLVEAEMPGGLWHEQSSIWEIISGEIVRQHDHEIAADPEALLGQARERCIGAAESLRAGDRDAAGHSLIGCSLALALAARPGPLEGTPIDRYGAELAASVASQAREPRASELDGLARQISRHARRPEGRLTSPRRPLGARTLWELAVAAGSFAAGLSAHISRRRQRRDEIEG